MNADREAANERAGRIEVEGDKPKVEPTLRYFAEVRASLKNGQDALRDIEAELAATREQLREVSRKFTLAEEDARLFRERERAARVAFGHAKEEAQRAQGERDEAREREAKLREALQWIGTFATGHHADQEGHVLLHALLVDIPAYCDAALADGEGET